MVKLITLLLLGSYLQDSFSFKQSLQQFLHLDSEILAAGSAHKYHPWSLYIV